MKLLQNLWTTVSCVINWLTLSPVETPSPRQYPLTQKLDAIHDHQALLEHGVATTTGPPGPVFTPPTARVWPNDGYDYTCDYSAMIGFTNCSTQRDRGCWLYNQRSGEKYDLFTDYETKTPIGIDRYYTLYANENVTLNADGQKISFGKAFNSTFPGPWVQGCCKSIRIRYAQIVLAADAFPVQRDASCPFPLVTC